MSFSFFPRVVSAAVPNRIPDGSTGVRVSNGTVFLFTVIPAAAAFSLFFKFFFVNIYNYVFKIIYKNNLAFYPVITQHGF